MRTPELKTAILRMAGKGEFYGYEIHKKLEERKIKIGIGRLYSILSDMKNEGFLKDRWEESQSGPKRRVYRISKKGNIARDEILGEAIKTVHEFYTEYLFSLPSELSVFNMISDLLVEKLPINANVAYAASRFSGPMRKIMESLQDKFPDGNLYAIHPREKNVQLGMDSVSVVDGTFEDIPMKDDYLNLLVVTGNIPSDCLDVCLREWQRVLGVNGRLAIITTTALLSKYVDPLDIGEFIEQREHPRLDSEDLLDLEILSNEVKKYFAHVDVVKVVHITVIRGFNPRT
ncbi:MAG: PadR family transcriptional regulator [Candidatus Thorarchaeota archaeon]|nr:MAG: PadR family transcriptional regulator [Candidatus Thorarchaeota archaeon]